MFSKLSSSLHVRQLVDFGIRWGRGAAISLQNRVEVLNELLFDGLLTIFAASSVARTRLTLRSWSALQISRQDLLLPSRVNRARGLIVPSDSGSGLIRLDHSAWSARTYADRTEHCAFFDGGPAGLIRIEPTLACFLCPLLRLINRVRRLNAHSVVALLRST